MGGVFHALKLQSWCDPLNHIYCLDLIWAPVYAESIYRGLCLVPYLSYKFQFWLLFFFLSKFQFWLEVLGTTNLISVDQVLEITENTARVVRSRRDL